MIYSWIYAIDDFIGFLDRIDSLFEDYARFDKEVGYKLSGVPMRARFVDHRETEEPGD